MKEKRPDWGRSPRRPGQVVTASVACPICNESHDEIIRYLAEAEYRRIPDDELAAELAYVERELVDDEEPRRRGALQHRVTVLKNEAGRRRRLAAKGGPLYKGRASVSADRIEAVKRIDVTEIIGRDQELAWVRGGRAGFRCTNHGDGVDAHPSLVAYDDGHWRCYVCNSGGDVIDWLIARRGLGFRQAVEELERWAA
jgi:hypothetical protein